MNEHHLIAVEWIKKEKIAFILSNGSTIFVSFDPITCDLVEIITDKFLQSKFQCDQLINGNVIKLLKLKAKLPNIFYCSHLHKTSFAMFIC